MSSFHAADGALLSFAECGPRGGIPLVLVHGWLADATVWEPLVEALGERHRTIAVDLRGFGASNGAQGAFSIESFSNDLADLIAAIDLDPVVVVGHSMGAAVAQRFAIDHPEAVEGLVLIAAGPASGVAFPPKIEAMFRAAASDKVVAARWLDGLAYGEWTPELSAVLHAAAARANHAAAAQSLEAWLHADFAAEAATIETPTLVIAPSADRPMTPDFLRKNVADVITDSRFVVLDKAGHYATVERPMEISALIDDFIELL